MAPQVIDLCSSSDEEPAPRPRPRTQQGGRPSLSNQQGRDQATPRPRNQGGASSSGSGRNGAVGGAGGDGTGATTPRAGTGVVGRSRASGAMQAERGTVITLGDSSDSAGEDDRARPPRRTPTPFNKTNAESPRKQPPVTISSDEEDAPVPSAGRIPPRSRASNNQPRDADHQIETLTLLDTSDEDEDLPPASTFFRRSSPRHELAKAQSAAAGSAPLPSASQKKREPTSSTSNAKPTPSQPKPAPTTVEAGKDAPPPPAARHSLAPAADAIPPPQRGLPLPQQQQQPPRKEVVPATGPVLPLPPDAFAQPQNLFNAARPQLKLGGEGGSGSVSQAAERAFTGARREAGSASAGERSTGSSLAIAGGQKAQLDTGAPAAGLDLPSGATSAPRHRPQPQSSSGSGLGRAIQPPSPAEAIPIPLSSFAHLPPRPQPPSHATLPSRPPPSNDTSGVPPHNGVGSGTLTVVPARQESQGTAGSSEGILGGLSFDFAQRAIISKSLPHPSPDSRPTQKIPTTLRSHPSLPDKPGTPTFLAAKHSPAPRPDLSQPYSPLPQASGSQPPAQRKLVQIKRTSKSYLGPKWQPGSNPAESTLEADLDDLSLGSQALPKDVVPDLAGRLPPPLPSSHQASPRPSLDVARPDRAVAPQTNLQAATGPPSIADSLRAEGRPRASLPPPSNAELGARPIAALPPVSGGRRAKRASYGIFEPTGRTSIRVGGSERGSDGGESEDGPAVGESERGSTQGEELQEGERRLTAAEKGKGRAREVDEVVGSSSTTASSTIPPRLEAPPVAPASVLTQVGQLGGRIGSHLSKRRAETLPVVEPTKRLKQGRASDGTFEVKATLSQVFVPRRDGGEATRRQHVAIEYQPDPAASAMDTTTDDDLHLSVSANHSVDVRRGVPKADVFPVFVEQADVELGGEEDVVRLDANVVTGALRDPVADAQRQKDIAAYLEDQRTTRSHFRNIAGPSFPGEFDSGVQDDVSYTLAKHLAHYSHLPEEDRPELDTTYQKELFENMIFESNANEIMPRYNPRIRIFPPDDGDKPHAPPFEFYWTNRVVYPPDLLPEQSPGCDCEGRCQDPENIDSCACRKRQIEVCKTRADSKYDRSEHKGFAYNEGGQIVPEMLPEPEPVWECNSHCECDDGCINRVVGLKKGVDVDIYHTASCGWGVRNPPEADLILAGTPLGIYGSELLGTEDVDTRVNALYEKCGRNYIFDLDHWTIEDDHLLARKAATAIGPKPKKSKAKKGKKNKQQQQPVATEEDEFEVPYSGDAFFFGNWTRFVNHRCSGANAAARPVYVDEGNLYRPLHVFVATKNIQPGEQICISYYTNDDPQLKEGQRLCDYKRLADDRRRRAKDGLKCMCGEALCRGIMFKDANLLPAGESDSDA